MVWQDIVLAGANFLFSFAVISQVFYGFKKKRGFVLLKTSGLTSLGLYLISICYFTLSLFWSGIICSLNATLWAILFFQRVAYGKA